MWAALVERAATPLDDAGPRAAWRPRTQGKKRQSYSTWLTHITLRHPEMLALAPVDRVTPTTVQSWIAVMSDLVASQTRLLRAVDLMTIVTGAAPEQNWSWLHAAVRHLQHATTSTLGKAARVRPAGMLVDLGMAMMDDADAGRECRPDRRAPLYRDGLIIAFLALRPLRLRNLMNLELGRTMRLRPNCHYETAYGPEETKTGEPIEFGWPEDLQGQLERYLRVYRPHLLGRRQSSMLWIGIFGDAMAEQTIRQAITGRTRDRLGVAINPHLFRDCAATTMAVEDPAHVGLASVLLGHANTNTTDRHYQQASSLSASRHHQTALAALRERLRPPTALPETRRRRSPASASLPLFPSGGDRRE